MLLIVFFSFVFSVFMDGYTFVLIALFSIINWIFWHVWVDKLGDSKLVRNSIYKLFSLFSISCSALLFNLCYQMLLNFSTWFLQRMGSRSFLFIVPTSAHMDFDIDNWSWEKCFNVFWWSSVFKSTFLLPLLIFFFFRLFCKN